MHAQQRCKASCLLLHRLLPADFGGGQGLGLGWGEGAWGLPKGGGGTGDLRFPCH